MENSETGMAAKGNTREIALDEGNNTDRNGFSEKLYRDMDSKPAEEYIAGDSG